jgi:hypothetical protein
MLEFVPGVAVMLWKVCGTMVLVWPGESSCVGEEVLRADSVLVGVTLKSPGTKVLFASTGGKPEEDHVLVTVLLIPGTLTTIVIVPLMELGLVPELVLEPGGTTMRLPSLGRVPLELELGAPVAGLRFVIVVTGMGVIVLIEVMVDTGVGVIVTVLVDVTGWVPHTDATVRVPLRDTAVPIEVVCVPFPNGP